MNLTIPKKSLLSALVAPEACAERKSTMPILSNVLLECDGARLTISGTDLYIASTATVPVDRGDVGSVAVSGKGLLERVKLMPDGPLTLESKGDGQVTLRAAGKARRYVLASMPGSDFPTLMQPPEDAPTLAIEPAVLSGLIEKVSPAVSPDETRAHLNSLKLEWRGEVVIAVATDGHRLHKAEAKVDGVQGNLDLLIPLKGVLELRRFCEAASGDVTLVQNGSHLFLSRDGAMVSVKLVDAQFPPYEQVIPKHTSGATLPASQAIEVVKAVAVAADDKTGGIKLTFSESRMKVTAESPDGGSAEDFVELEESAKELTVGASAKYFVEALQACILDQGPEARVSLAYGGPLDPMLFECGAVSLVIMPVRI